MFNPYIHQIWKMTMSEEKSLSFLLFRFPRLNLPQPTSLFSSSVIESFLNFFLTLFLPLCPSFPFSFICLMPLPHPSFFFTNSFQPSVLASLVLYFIPSVFFLCVILFLLFVFLCSSYFFSIPPTLSFPLNPSLVHCFISICNFYFSFLPSVFLYLHEKCDWNLYL